MIKGAIFDMDGLMFDTEMLASKGWLQAAKELNYPITEETVSIIRGTNMATSREIFKREFGDSVDYDAARTIRTDYVNQMIEEHGVPVKHGLLELLKYLKVSGRKLAVATSTERKTAETYLKLANVYPFFDMLVFGDEVKHGKPAPDIFLHAAGKLALKPEECVVFEDSPHGIKAAYDAGTKIIGVQDLSVFDDKILKLLNYNCKTLEHAIPLIDTL